MYGDYVKKSVRTAAILTGSYVAGTVVDSHGFNQLVVLVAFTKGSLTTAEFKVEFSDNNSTYYQETSSSITGGTDTNTLLEHQISATGNYEIKIPIKARYIKISAKGTGTATSSSMTVDVVLGTV